MLVGVRASGGSKAMTSIFHNVLFVIGLVIRILALSSRLYACESRQKWQVRNALVLASRQLVHISPPL